MLEAAADAPESSPPPAGFWVARLNAEDAAAAWEKVSPFIASAIAASDGMYLAEDVLELVTGPHAGTPRGWSLWILAEGTEPMAAWTTHVRYYPRGRSLEVSFAGGRDMARWYEIALAETEKFAAEAGCSRLRCGGRAGWQRRGYRLIGHLFERVVG